MDAKLFWQLLEDVSNLGEFVAGTWIKGAESNIVGTFQVAFDGHEIVFKKQDCRDHFHFAPEKIQAFHFGYCQVTTGGADPCIELFNEDSEVCLRLFYYPYQDKELKPKYEQFMAQHQAYRNLLTGEW